MRERESCSPSENRAVCTITPTYYDRRALDTQADYALCSSLAYLADLAQQSPKIRESLACDGGLEQIVRILKRGKVKRIPDRWQLVKWQSALLCVFNIGVRGSEFVRTRVVEAEMIPVVVTVLCQTLDKLERAQQYARYLASQQRYTVRQSDDRRNNYGGGTTAPVPLRSHAGIGTITPVSRSTTPATSGPEDSRDETATPPPFARADRVGGRPESAAAVLAVDGPAELTRRMNDVTISTANAAAAAAAAIDAGRPPTSSTVASGSGDHATNENSPTTSSSARQTARPARSAALGYVQADADGSDAVSTDLANDLATSGAAHGPNGSHVSAAELLVRPHGGLDFGLGLVSTGTIPTGPGLDSALDDSGDTTTGEATSTSMDSRSPAQASRVADSIPVRPTGTRPLSMPVGTAVQAGQAAKDLVVPSHLDSDVVMCLKLLAYLSKYPSLREAFQRSYDVPMLKQNLKQYDYYCSMDHPAGPFEPMDEDLSDELQMPFNVFQLVERFTARPPDEAAYWAGVTMRNSCRKDESRGGVRQCAYLECGKWEQSNRQFAKCRRCRRTKYCSKQCQSNAWPGHKWWCSASRDQADIASSSAAVTGAQDTGAAGSISVIAPGDTQRLHPS